MSKMSQLAMELDDQAVELGFENYEEALAKGYEVDYEERKLVNPYVLDREQNKAHEAWLEEQQSVLADLKELRSGFAEGGYHDEMDALDRAIAFVKEAHD